ncbi:GrpB family protein [Streptomyces antibioticus]|uniref:GrpB family protein n=1 Tax=Streptomyces antibioticus TaxID=1890 RepID=UPI0036AB4416
MDLLRDHLLFHDHLCVDAEGRTLYESVERDLFGRRWNDMNDYADAKTDAILAVRSRARAARR